METVFELLANFEWLGTLLARLAVGLLFAISGWGKLTKKKKRAQMVKTQREAGVPQPELMARLVSAIELVAGLLLLIGFLTPLAALLLAGVMVVAITTVKLKGIEADGIVAWLGEFLFIPDVLYLVILIWLLFAGPGAVSVDRLLF